MFQFWMVWKYLKGGGRFIGWTSFLALLGLVIGVGALVLTMSVISGVETHLKRSIIDVSGHFLFMDRRGHMEPPGKYEHDFKKLLGDVKAISPFVHMEGMVASEGKLSGVIVQGLEPTSYQSVFDLHKRVEQGKVTFKEANGLPQAVVGSVLANKLGLKPGSELKIVIPRPNQVKPKSFSPRVRDFVVSGVLDMGKYDFNERLVLTSANVAQDMKGIGDKYSGYRMRFLTDEGARSAELRLRGKLKHDFYAKDWYQVNYNFFSAVEIEKWVIFIVLLFVVIVACFNVCSTLFVHVLKRYSDISVLKTLGAGESFLVKLFISHGLFVGIIGAFGGVLLGLVLCEIVEQATWLYVPGEIYKFDRLPIEVRISDLLVILGATFVACFLSTLLPAIRGAKLKPVEGLRYE